MFSKCLEFCSSLKNLKLYHNDFGHNYSFIEAMKTNKMLTKFNIN